MLVEEVVEDTITQVVLDLEVQVAVVMELLILVTEVVVLLTLVVVVVELVEMDMDLGINKMVVMVALEYLLLEAQVLEHLQ
jgi:hypothetical protein